MHARGEPQGRGKEGDADTKKQGARENNLKSADTAGAAGVAGAAASVPAVTVPCVVEACTADSSATRCRSVATSSSNAATCLSCEGHRPPATTTHSRTKQGTAFPQSPPAGSPCLAGRQSGVHWQQQPLAPVLPGPAASEGGRCQRSSGTDKFGIATLGRYTRILLRKYCRKQTAALRYRRPSQTASRVIQFCAVTSTTTAPWGTQCAECMHEQGDRDNGNTANYDQPDGGPASEAANGSSALQGAGVGGGNTKS